MSFRDWIVWWNGEVEPISAVRISPLDRGFQYGDGLFETIRVEKGRALFLEEHLRRLGKSLRELGFNKNSENIRLILDASEIEGILRHLLERNGLGDWVSRLKIIITRGVTEGLGMPEPSEPTVLVMVVPYKPPDNEEYERGWDVVTLSHLFTPCFANHKTLNYLTFLMAREQARMRGAQEALLVDKAGYVSDGAASNFILFVDGFWVEPLSEWKLPGITMAKVVEFLQEMEQKVVKRRVCLQDLQRCDALWVTNSMVGVMPVRSVDGRSLPELKADLAGLIRRRLFS